MSKVLQAIIISSRTISWPSSWLKWTTSELSSLNNAVLAAEAFAGRGAQPDAARQQGLAARAWDVLEILQVEFLEFLSARRIFHSLTKFSRPNRYLVTRFARVPRTYEKLNLVRITDLIFNECQMVLFTQRSPIM